MNCSSEEHQLVVLDAIRGLDGIEVLSHEDRTFSMHKHGKIEVRSLAPARVATTCRWPTPPASPASARRSRRTPSGCTT
ncbi:MAG: hypothetical protein R2699_07345 [Acidimicrobiales bacterium]